MAIPTVGNEAPGTLKYNGIEFDAADQVNVNAEPVYDDSGRTIVAQRYTLTVRAILADDDLDSDLETIRRDLCVPGKRFEYNNRGFGNNLTIDPSGGGDRRQVDILGGPFPQELDWQPLGAERAGEILWQIVFAIPCCEKGKKPRKMGIMALNYSIGYRMDMAGDTTRTIQGYLQIVEKAGPRPADSSDRYRERIGIGGVPGFKREQEWRTNDRESRTDFRIVDTQIPSPNAYPDGAVQAEARHRVNVRRGQVGHAGNISATITPRAGTSGAAAWLSFTTLVGSRLALMKARGQKPWIDSIDMEENIFSRTHSFAVQYRTMGRLRDILQDTGIWQPLKNTSWTRWAASMQDAGFNYRGNAKMRNVAANNVIVNLCTPVETVEISSKVELRPTPGPALTLRRPITNKKPDPDRSYLKYRHKVVPIRSSSTTKHQPVQSPSADEAYFEAQQRVKRRNVERSFQMETPASGQLPDIIQEDTAKAHTVAFIGEAERAGFPVPRPAVEKVGNKTAHEVAGSFILEDMGDTLGTNVFRAKWFLLYELEGSPGQVDPPPKQTDNDENFQL